MKLHNEIISDLVKPDEGISAEDAHFNQEGTDTGYIEGVTELCDECKSLGFCKRLNPERFEVHNQTSLQESNV